MTEQTIPQKFHIGDMLSITCDRLVSPSDPPIDGVYKILNYLTGDNLYTHQLPRAIQECKPEIIRQHPWIDDPEVSVVAIGELILMLAVTKPEDIHKLILGWLSKLSAKYGEYHELMPVPFSVNHKDAMEELQEMVPPEKIIAIERG